MRVPDNSITECDCVLCTISTFVQYDLVTVTYSALLFALVMWEYADCFAGDCDTGGTCKFTITTLAYFFHQIYPHLMGYNITVGILENNTTV